MTVQIISYYSPNYALHAAKLIESLDRWDIPKHQRSIEPVAPFPSWHHGVSRKPQFIYEMMHRLHQCDGFLWLDADSYLTRRIPWEVLKGADVAGTLFQWSPGHRQELLTGTMYFANRPNVIAFVGEWARLTKLQTGSDTPEQDALLPLIMGTKQTVAFEPLSIEWAFINDEKVREQYPKAIPIVMHSQASREIKRQEAIARR